MDKELKWFLLTIVFLTILAIAVEAYKEKQQAVNPEPDSINAR